MRNNNRFIYEALNWASSLLLENNRDENGGEILLRHYLNVTRAQLFANIRSELSETVANQFTEAINRHLAGEPIQYIIGAEHFYGRRFKVNNSVLIPRPETEELIVHLLDNLRGFSSAPSNLKLVDIGTGSGAIAITMKLQCPTLNVTATDISEAALKTAEENAHNLGAQIQFINGDLCAPLLEENMKFDIIVSNPPYIPEKDRTSLSKVVKDFEPAEALFAGEDGLAIYKRLGEQLPQIVNKKALIGLEIGTEQTEAVRAIFRATFPNGDISVEKDINGKDRFIIITLQ